MVFKRNALLLRKSPNLNQPGIALNLLVSLFRCLVARVNVVTDRQTEKPTDQVQLTLAAHARRGLASCVGLFHMDSVWFDYTEPSLTAFNLLDPFHFRENKATHRPNVGACESYTFTPQKILRGQTSRGE